MSQAQLPSTLYHYCGAQGFKGIVEGKAVWLSDVRYCNDYMEHNWLKVKYDFEIDKLRANDPSTFHDALAKAKANYREHVAFVACFSTNKDVLSQWRAYADDGAGFAIGFNPKYFDLQTVLPSYGNEATVTCGIVPVCYDEAEQMHLIQSILEDYRVKATSSNDVGFITESAEECYFKLQMAAISCKNPAFKEESEWRIIYRPMIRRNKSGVEVIGGLSDICFRVSKQSIVSYFKLQFSEERTSAPITEVVLGPKRSLTNERDVLTWFLENNGVFIRGFVQSGASYR